MEEFNCFSLIFNSWRNYIILLYSYLLPENKNQLTGMEEQNKTVSWFIINILTMQVIS